MMRKVSDGIDDLAFTSTNNFCRSFSTLPAVGAGEEAFRDREETATASSPTAVTAPLETNLLMWNKNNYGGKSIGMVGHATVDATLAEGGLLGVSNPSQRQPQGFQNGTGYFMPNNTPVLQSHGEMNSLENKTNHAGSSGAGATPSSDHSGGGAGFLCHACGISNRCRPTVCCRKCRKLYHPLCAGYEPSRRKYPPPDWICPMCPGGKQGPKEKYLHPSLRGKGTVTLGNQPWCPVCFEDNRVPGRKKSLDGGQKCVGCGLKAHAECQRLRPDGTWPCVECHLRAKNMAPGIFLPAPESMSMDRSSQTATVMSSLNKDRNDKHTLAHQMENNPRVLEAAPTKSGTSVDAVKINKGSSKESKSGVVARADAPGECKSVSHAMNSLGCSCARESQQTILQRKGGVNLTATPGSRETPDAVMGGGELRNSSKQTPGAERASRRGSLSGVDAMGSSRWSNSLRRNVAGATVMTPKASKKKGKLKSGKTCAGCKHWWRMTGDCSSSGRGKSGPTNLGKWIGGWRCQGCLDKWENDLKIRTARVVKAWAGHEKMRREKENDFRTTKEAAIAESLREKRHGVFMSTVEVVSDERRLCLLLITLICTFR